ncbi:SHOCT domain-containing protein [Pseudooceanicola spongiae]|uniref:SHOCT domain-containing protein n=1 Tax=Pseudooceanicola spongiae TaxID=2613965 RepID=A0A7L9WTF6_9RHOB|nr:hypothetical protein [Pseudooceanicola spongiae]QOL82808.1 hypothetical protein F3W81_19440 [Pseudooceanicola spongiae]
MKRIALLLAIMAQPALADTDGYGHMMDGGYGYGMGMMFGPVLWLIVLGLIVAGVIWFVRRMDGHHAHGAASSARSELDLRFARGEIEAEDYAARKALLTT